MLSHITKMPQLSELDIPAKQYELYLSDGLIFRGLLNAERGLEHPDGPAADGDYVLALISTEKGGETRLQAELGSRRFPELERALTGRAAGEGFTAEINGEAAQIRVEAVSRAVDLPLTDGAIAALGIPGVASLADYRRAFIRENGEARAERVFSSIKQRLLTRLAGLAEAYIEPQELARYHARQRAMINNISGDVDGRLMDAYGCDTPEECDRLFYEDNRRNFTIYLYGLALAEENGRVPSEAERMSAMQYYGIIYDLDAADISAAGLEDEAMQSFYLQYGIASVREHYFSLVRFSAEGIEPMAIGE